MPLEFCPTANIMPIVNLYLKKLGILPFPQLCTFFKWQFMQRFIQGFLPDSFDLISLQPLISFPKNWENFPDDRIKFICNKLEFNSELKKHFLQTLNETVACNRLFCPSCFN